MSVSLIKGGVASVLDSPSEGTVALSSALFAYRVLIEHKNFW